MNQLYQTGYFNCAKLIYRNIILYTFCSLFFSIIAQGQQDIRQLAATQEGTIYNPSLIGKTPTPSLFVLARQQWVGTAGAPAVQFIQFNSPLKNNKAGAGLSVSHFSAGYFKEIDFSAAYAYKIQWNDKISTRLGIQASLKNYGIDFRDKNIITQRADDPSIPLGTKVNQFRGSFGFGWSLIVENWVTLGFSLPRLYQNEIGINEAVVNTATTDPLFVFSLRGRLPSNDDFKILPAFVFKKLDYLPLQLDFNVTFIIKSALDLGIGTSRSETVKSMHFNTAYSLTKNCKMGLFYEFPISKITNGQSSSFEFYLNFLLQKK